MKKKRLTALILVAALAATPVTALAAGSAEYSDGGSGSSYSSGSSRDYATTVTVSSTGVKTTGATTSSNGGSSIGVAVDTVTSTGQQVTVNSKGEAVIGDTAIGFAMGVAATAGLPNAVVSSIEAINAGQDLATVTTDVDLTGYSALTGTHAIITKDASTAAVKTGVVEVSLYVPNLLDSLEGVSVLFYDNATGRWVLLQPIRVDAAAKTVTVNVSGSGTLSVVYKR